MCGTVDEVAENALPKYKMLPSLAQLLPLLVRMFLSQEYSLLRLIASCVMQGLCVHLCGCMHPYSAWKCTA